MIRIQGATLQIKKDAIYKHKYIQDLVKILILFTSSNIFTKEKVLNNLITI